MKLILSKDQLDDLQMFLYEIKDEYITERTTTELSGWDHNYYTGEIEKYEKIITDGFIDLTVIN